MVGRFAKLPYNLCKPLSQEQPHPHFDQGSVAKAAEPSFLTIGQVSKPHGVHGEVRVILHTDVPERFTWLKEVYVGQNSSRLVAVEGARLHQNMVLLKLAGYDDREAAETLRGAWLQVPEAEAIPLAEGEYFLYQIEGLTVVTDTGELLGTLLEVIETGANNVFRVVGPRGEVLLPDTREVILDIDFDNGRVTVHLLPGLLPE
ncbi:MAG: 16S rRNA processing protein RimM [Chloroflexi bacterium]|nr:16S rRNA processing protein RimM [Chloroflexota bacterium]